jgi:hypothetical protein
LLTTIGATALGFGIVIGGAAEMPAARAQEAGPAQTQPASDFDAQRAHACDAFVAALASELGDDEAAVDAAIRTALKQHVDERQAAGDLDAEQAAAMKAVIDVSEAPLFSGFGGRGGMHDFDGHDGTLGPGGRDRFEGRGPRGGFDDGIGDLPGNGTSPATLPGNGGPADQSVPVPLTPAEDIVL